jgi:2'-5' RNA ligase
MRQPDFYRYFLAFRPDIALRCWLESVADSAGQHERRIRADYFHLTLCVIAEPEHRDRFVVSRVHSALAGLSLFSCPFWLGRVRGGRNGAAVHAMGRQGDIQDFYRMLLVRLSARGMLPLHRKSGLRPHATLGYDPCAFEPFNLPREWIPDELLLIESEVGNSDHHVLARWPLLPPRQGAFAFESPPLLLSATGRRP